ncbi:MAG: hypothetical protein RI894_786, partial [Bacteroidota bacterium]
MKLDTSRKIALFLLLTLPLFSIAQQNPPKHIRTKSSDTEAVQDSTPKPKKDDEPAFKRWYYGGNLGLSFYNSLILADISPQIGYRLTEKFMVGGGIIGQPIFGTIPYTNYNGQRGRADVFGGSFGADLFLRYDLIWGIFAQAEGQYIYRRLASTVDPSNGKIGYLSGTIPYALLGPGAHLNAGAVRLNVMV